MSLVKCKECGNKISSEAKQCPKCGYKKKKIIGFWGVIFILALIGYTSQMFEDKFGSNDKVKSENKSTTSKVSENKINQAGRDALQYQYTDPGYVESSFPQKESIANHDQNALYRVPLFQKWDPHQETHNFSTFSRQTRAVTPRSEHARPIP